MIGLGLLFASLALDGYTGPTQENIIKDYKPTSKFDPDRDRDHDHDRTDGRI